MNVVKAFRPVRLMNDKDRFMICVILSEVESSAFSKPYNNWHLSAIDEKLIDELEKRYSAK
jgi:hypothetical protein